MQTEPFGEEITDYVRFSIPRAKQDGATLKGVVLRVDVFGNLMTNFTADDLPANTDGRIKLKVAGKPIEKLMQTFAQGAPGEPIAIVGSNGFLEVAVNKGSAARTLTANRGAEVILEVS
jgi:S-adenosylmethionine hydrolase